MLLQQIEKQKRGKIHKLVAQSLADPDPWKDLSSFNAKQS